MLTSLVKQLRSAAMRLFHRLVSIKKIHSPKTPTYFTHVPKATSHKKGRRLCVVLFHQTKQALSGAWREITGVLVRCFQHFDEKKDRKAGDGCLRQNHGD